MEVLHETLPPKIGLNRTFFKDILVNPFLESEDTEFIVPPIVEQEQPKENIEQNPNSIIFESILQKNLNNMKNYREKGGVLIYHDDEIYKKNSIIDYDKLMTILSFDESANENFISKEKGNWINYNSISNIKETTTNDPNNSNENFDVEFESRFESGNLRMSIQIAEDEYDLLLKNDINALKYTQWYFFQVKIKSKTKKTIKFNFINCEKEESIYNKGKKALIFSNKTQKWSRNNRDIFYYPNGLSIEAKKFYTLTFTFDVDGEDTLYFAYHYPYTFSHLQNYLDSIERNKSKSIIRREVIGQTLAGNNIDLLLISDFSALFEEIAVRPAVIFTARVHPGESNSSFVMQGIIEFLVSMKPVAIKLRTDYVFKIVPMLNPDGVINGNFRCSLIGKDLNRLWQDPRDNICPTIFYTKEMIKTTLLSRSVYLFCDFHGHSNKNNFFLYGCETEGKEGRSYQERVLAKLINMKNDSYDMASSFWKIRKAKKTTARAVVKNDFNITYSYCLEASLCGISIGKNKNKFFTPASLLEIGNDFCLSLFDLSNKNLFLQIFNSFVDEETNKILNKQSGVSSSNNLPVVGKKDKADSKFNKKDKIDKDKDLDNEIDAKTQELNDFIDVKQNKEKISKIVPKFTNSKKISGTNMTKKSDSIINTFSSKEVTKVIKEVKDSTSSSTKTTRISISEASKKISETIKKKDEKKNK